ncbi:amidohydrolase [Mesorhizobium sp. Cs1299R1N1]|uniref:amidohydrolase n=1 Tax=Mesorhizobium sp. Cs1299R1N1 TaxID=3015172 RepID=UPI00301DBE3D
MDTAKIIKASLDKHGFAGAPWRANVSRRAFVSGATAVAASAGFLPKASHAEGATTTIFAGGTILTVDANFSEAEAMAVRGNQILAVGKEADVRTAAGAGATVVDLAGKVMLPGFIDAHGHVISGSVIAAMMDYVGMARFARTAEVLGFLKDKAGKTPAGEWIVARNFDPAVQEGPDALTFAELDAVSTEHPVFIMNASGHLAYANTKAFEGVPDDIANPPGAEFVRDASGKLTGVMKNNTAFLQILGRNPAAAKADPVGMLISLLEQWGKLGLTMVSEFSLGTLTQSTADADVMHAAAQSGRLKARLRTYPFYSLGAEAWEKADVKPGDGNALARIAGYKLVADGSNQGFTGLQRDPYVNSDSRGIAYMSADELKQAAVEQAMKGWPIAIHGNGDAAIDNVLDACEAVKAAGADMSKVRPRIEHCSILHDEQISRMKKLGLSASFLIGHVHYWGVAMRDDVFGPDKVLLLDRCKSAEDAGVGFTLHSDFMVTDPHPLHMIEMAVTRKTWKEPDFVLAPNERISVERAIRAMTSEAAWQLGSEHEVGSLEAGKLADFVILEKDPRKVDPDTIKSIAVLETWMDGKQVFKA